MSREELIQLLLRAEFFNATRPTFDDLAKTVQDAGPRYVESSRTRCCGGDPNVMAPALDRLLDQLQASPDAQAVFREFVAAKKGYAIDQIALYYRKGKEAHPRKVAF